jgi:hypothetical protein
MLIKAKAKLIVHEVVHTLRPNNSLVSITLAN